MRILFATTAGSGHFHPLVRLAQAVVRAGHTVAFACPQSLYTLVERSGFQPFSMLDLDSLAQQRAAVMRQFAPLTKAITADSFVSGVFIGI